MTQDRKYAAVSLCPKSQDILTLDGGGHPYQPGVCFQDGIRRVDYVLTYNAKKSCRTLRPSLSITANGFFRRLRRSLQCSTEQPPGANRDSAVEMAALDQQEEEKRFLRDEFEDNLRDMGLELEKDEHSKIPGVGFLKIHAPWDVLCREAEFLKLKMPTTEVYQATSRKKMVKLKGFIENLTKPLLPDVEESRTHNPKHVCYPFSREKQHLFDLSDRETFFDTKTRGLIVFEVLKRTKFMSSEEDVGFPSLLAKGIYTSAYPLHDGDVDDDTPTANDRKILYNEWASYSCFYKYQPIGLIRKYFGDKIGLYFAWLGLYTQMLIFASLVGVLVFLYGCITVDHDIPSMEICDKRNNITMCPMCDRACGYWKLKMACGTARASHLFDNTATVLFSVFMALWASTFMEKWKRKQMRLNYKWDLTNFEEEEDHPRTDYENKVKEKILKRTEKKPHKETKTVKLTWRDRCPAYMTFIVSMLLMKGGFSGWELRGSKNMDRLWVPKDWIGKHFFVSFAIVLAIIIYRVTTQAALQMSTVSTARSNVRLTVVSTAVIINLVVILILDEVYAKVAVWLTQLEVPKTDASYEQRLIIKTFILKFLNSFSPIFYVAFMRGKLIGRPGKYLYILGSYRMEECAHTGCLMELCIQLSITMLGKQLIQNNLFEIGIPKLKKLIKRFKSKRGTGQQDPFSGNLRRYEKDHFHEPFGSLNPEYMEMIIQYGFVTLFVASFPLAPVFALLNNVLEIRLDAKKFIAELRRPVPARAKDIGIWYNILSGLSKVAIVVNAFVIAFTSDFIPRLVYQYGYSPDGTMHGFINHTLSYFNVSHFEPDTDPLKPLHLGYQVNVCRFKDYRLAPWSKTPYEVSKVYWAVLAARLAFVIIFQNVVMLMSDFVDWVIPDIPKEVTIRIYEEKKQIVEFFLKEEQTKTQSLHSIAPEGDRDQSNNQAYPQRL